MKRIFSPDEGQQLDLAAAYNIHENVLLQSNTADYSASGTDKPAEHVTHKQGAKGKVAAEMPTKPVTSP